MIRNLCALLNLTRNMVSSSFMIPSIVVKIDASQCRMLFIKAYSTHSCYKCIQMANEMVNCSIERDCINDIYIYAFGTTLKSCQGMDERQFANDTRKIILSFRFMM